MTTDIEVQGIAWTNDVFVHLHFRHQTMGVGESLTEETARKLHEDLGRALGLAP